eukprot:12478556-Prorocentrum_lima.AAC.1
MQATLATHCMVRLSAAMGLHLESHSCRGLRTGAIAGATQAALRNLPVRFTQCRGGWEVTGVNPRLLDRLLSR